MKYSIKTPKNYDPMISLFFCNTKKSWGCDYLLPSEDKIKCRVYLPKNKVKTQGHAIKLRDQKRDDLIKGKLLEREYKKLAMLQPNLKLTLNKAISNYLNSTALSKSARTREGERKLIPKIFQYFEKEFKITFINEIKDKHVQYYQSYLKSKALERKEIQSLLLPKIESTNDFELKRKLTQSIRTKGLSPATAQSYFKTLKKVLNKLAEENVIPSSPAKEIRAISIPTQDAVRSKTFEPSDIIKISESNYVHQTDFPMILFVLFLGETGARFGEGAHIEWTDIDFKSRIWEIKGKPKCPTRYGLGWFPKWNRERKVYLSDAAIKILELIPRENAVGYIPVREVNDEGVEKIKRIPHPADFIFTAKDPATGKRRRIDSIKRAWASLLKKAGIPCIGFERFILHDLRRYRNVINECIFNLSAKERGEILGNSEVVNRRHYAGVASTEIIVAQGQMQELKTQNAELAAKNEKLILELENLKKLVND